jgi:hypothetical protein
MRHEPTAAQWAHASPSDAGLRRGPEGPLYPDAPVLDASSLQETREGVSRNTIAAVNTLWISNERGGRAVDYSPVPISIIAEVGLSEPSSFSTVMAKAYG